MFAYFGQFSGSQDIRMVMIDIHNGVHYTSLPHMGGYFLALTFSRKRLAFGLNV